jgi:AmmeMemoRadiSam system protein A
VLSYEGPFGVGYGVAILCQTGEPAEPAASAAGGELLPDIARRSLEDSFRGDDEPPAFPAEGLLAEPHAVFVTLHGPGGKLRGCVGTLSPKYAGTAAETWHVARSAAFHDGRFKPVTRRELEHLHFEVSVLLPPEEVASPADLDARRYGVIVSTDDDRRGVLLPDIEGVDTVAQQLDIARRKGGIAAGEPVRLQRFTVRKFCEARPEEDAP